MRPDPVPCGVCGRESGVYVEGLNLCYEHAAVANRLAKLKVAEDPFDLIQERSHGERENPKGELPTTYHIAPERDVERAARDVSVTIDRVPVFAVEALFSRLHNELGRPDIDEALVTLEVKFAGLDEKAYALLDAFSEQLWISIEHEVTKTRLYLPEHLMSEGVRRMDEAARQERDAQP